MRSRNHRAWVAGAGMLALALAAASAPAAGAEGPPAPRANPARTSAEIAPKPKPGAEAEAPAATPAGGLAASRSIGPRTSLIETRASAPAGGAQQTLRGAPVDTSGNLEIAADQLELRTEDRLVLFSGSVDAVRGTIRLRADRVLANYEESGGSAPADAAGGFGDISRLEAEGNVSVATSDRTARGGRAIYDVPARRITLVENVVLTADQSVVTGERLDIDLASGHFVLTPKASADGRVRGLFRTPGTPPAP
ncbi:MAG: hypothetical protein HXY25_06885 [Alphaproteobacteria bacterium]|nr:hypothetical protein [Alphaproteobacteria bacterium]